MAGKSYKVARATEPIWFDLTYTRKGVEKTRRFNCITSLPVGQVLDLATIFSVAEGDDEGPGMGVVKEIQDLYKSVILPEDYIVFEQLVRDPEVGIDINLYTEIIADLAAEYTARPTGANSQSSPQAPSSGTDSTDGASVVALTYSRPETPQGVFRSSSGG